LRNLYHRLDGKRAKTPVRREQQELSRRVDLLWQSGEPLEDGRATVLVFGAAATCAARSSSHFANRSSESHPKTVAIP